MTNRRPSQVIICQREHTRSSKGRAWHRKEAKLRIFLGRFPCLTRLRLSCGLLYDASLIPARAPPLRELKLKLVQTLGFWSDYLTSSVPQLTHLKLDKVWEATELLESAAWRPVSTLR